ncbi:GDSL family lipase [Niastella caeni]|uniref:GDSL family lipase n=1 Tax=Niastella caeni TaxID=2569763 RepID=A0A4S8HZM7_9BACT|nr:SGNH/GDSL hydrolase family protein [Niastella caeni]THU41308.1 GDSL family lipase [Niastella caeni]
MSTKKCCLGIVAIYIVCAGCFVAKPASAQAYRLPAAAFHPFGRSIINEQHNLELISSACQVGFRYTGTKFQLTVSIPSWMHHNYLQYELDGVYQKRIRVDSALKEPIEITAPTAGAHTIWIYKATEAHTGAIILHAASAQDIQALQRPAAPLIEFIGNSITCGAAADASEVPCGAGPYHNQHNAYMAYGPRVARALGVNYIMSSVSGIGIYRNWNSDNPIMLQVYENTDFQVQSQHRWNFSTYTPQIVSIALGTNDFSDGDGKTPRKPFDSATYVLKYIQFIQLVKTKYPTAQIALLSSGMLHDKKREQLQNCLTTVKEKIDALYPSAKPVALHFFQPMYAKGCTGHPSVEDHEVLAKELIPFYRKLLSN